MHYIIINSVTLAGRIKNHFRFIGKNISMMRTPMEISKGGCSYSIVVEKETVRTVLDTATELGIKVRGVYELSDGVFNEVKIL